MNTATPSFRELRLGEIAATLPGATEVFRRFDLDFCCHGDKQLWEEATIKQVEVEAVEAELTDIDGQAEAAPEETDALIEHILNRYHEAHRRELPELVRLADKVEKVHGNHPACPVGLANALRELLATLEAHMQKEESVLFPRMRAGGNPMISHPIAQMRYEHREHGEQLHHLQQLTGNCLPPDDSCATWRALYGGIRKLIDDLMAHVHLENNVLFPRFTGPRSE